MNNKYGINLRTHYAPLKRSKHYSLNTINNKSFINKPLKIFRKELNIDISYNNENKSRNKTPINTTYKTINNKFQYNPSLNIFGKKKNSDSNCSNKLKLKCYKSYTKSNPFYFQDKLNLIEKDKIENKIKNRLHLQREAIKQLYIYKLINPSKIEVLQKINELSYNPLIAYESKSPLQKKTINNYYYNDNIIKNNDVNIFNKPRKEIEDYYNKCQYQIPNTYQSDNIIHTKGKYINPYIFKNKFEKQITEEIIKYKNKKNKIEQDKINNVIDGKIKDKIYNDFNRYLTNKEKLRKKKLEKEIAIDNNLLTEYNQYIKNHINDGEKECFRYIRKKMEKEDIEKNNEIKNEKIRERKILNDWDNIYKKNKDIKNNEKIKEKQMWRNYSESFEINYNLQTNNIKKNQERKKYSKTRINRINSNFL